MQFVYFIVFFKELIFILTFSGQLVDHNLEYRQLGYEMKDEKNEKRVGRLEGQGRKNVRQPLSDDREFVIWMLSGAVRKSTVEVQWPLVIVMCLRNF